MMPSPAGAPARRRVLFSGYFGAGNLGDEAILTATLARFHALLGDSLDPVVATLDPNLTHRYQGAITTVTGSVLMLSEAIRSSDLVVWGGGGLLQDYWHLPVEDFLRNPRFGIPGYLRVPLLAAAWGVPCMMYAQGVGPIERAENRGLVGAIVNAVSAITVRDAGSADLLRSCGVRVPITVTADPAIALRAAPGAADRVAAATGLSAMPRPIVAVVPRIPPGGDRGWVAPCVAALDRWVDRSGGSAALVVFDHGDKGDGAICREIAGRLARPSSAIVVDAPLKPADIVALLSGCDATIATRLHGTLLSAVAGTPVLALDYDPKVRAAAEELGVPAFPLRELSIDAVVGFLHRVTADPDPVRTAIAARVAALTAREEANGLRAVALLSGDRTTPGAADAAAELRDAREWLAIARRQLEESEERASRLALELEHRDRLAADLERVSSELRALKASAGGRAMERYWNLSSRILPEGSRRRAIYRSLRRLSPPPEGAPDDPPPVAPAERDFVRELDDFEAALRREGKESVALIFSATVLREDEGQRPTQIALELSRRGIPVVFAFWRWSTDDPSPQDRLGAGIFQVPIDVAASNPDAIFGRFRGLSRRAIFEFPHPIFFESLGAAHAEGWTTVYDVLDDWEDFHRVGQAIWFREAFERHLLGETDVVVAVHPLLVERARALGARDPVLIPNGVRTEIAAVSTPRRIRRGRVTVGYFGYLAGAWFDWGLVAAAAAARPRWMFYLIGYGGAPEGIELPENVVRLGRIPQSDLAGYAARWDVGIVPFKASRLAAGADPIKTYEYLAMDLPVVVTGVSAPRGAEAHVTGAATLSEFLSAIERARVERRQRRGARRAFAQACTWSRRTDAFLQAIAAREARDGEKTAIFGSPR